MSCGLSRVYTSHERDLRSRHAGDHHRIEDKMQLNLHAIIYARCYVRALLFTHQHFLCIPRIGPARLRRSCRCPRRSRLRRIRRRGQPFCRCLRHRRIPHSSSRPLRTHRMHLPHLLRSCTCPRGCPSRRRPVCKFVCVSESDKERMWKMITNGIIQDHE